MMVMGQWLDSLISVVIFNDCRTLGTAVLHVAVRDGGRFLSWHGNDIIALCKQ